MPETKKTQMQRAAEWLALQEKGSEFNYKKMQLDLDMRQPTASGTLNAIARQHHPAVRHGSRLGNWIVTGYRVDGWTRPKPGSETAKAQPSSKKRLTRKPATEASSVEAGALLEALGSMKDGSLMLRDEAGSLWSAKQL